MVTKKKFILILAAAVAICSAMLIYYNYNYNLKSDHLTIKQAESRGQFKINIRKGDAGEFRTKSFKFSELKASSIEVFFRNEGTNQVVLSFVNSDKMHEEKNDSVSIKIPVGESVKKIFKNKSGGDDDKYFISITDPSEPLPVVIGEFYVIVR